MKRLYLLLAIVGSVVPYYFFLSFLLAKGFDVGLLLNQLFANDISSFFAVDLIITAIVLMISVYRDSKGLARGTGGYTSSPPWASVLPLLSRCSCTFASHR